MNISINKHIVLCTYICVASYVCHVLFGLVALNEILWNAVQQHFCKHLERLHWNIIQHKGTCTSFDTQKTSKSLLLNQLINFHFIYLFCLLPWLIFQIILHNLCSDNYTLALVNKFFKQYNIYYETHSDPCFPHQTECNNNSNIQTSSVYEFFIIACAFPYPNKKLWNGISGLPHV